MLKLLSLVSGIHSVTCKVMGKDDAKMRRKIGSADADIFRGGSEEIYYSGGLWTGVVS